MKTWMTQALWGIGGGVIGGGLISMGLGLGVHTTASKMPTTSTRHAHHITAVQPPVKGAAIGQVAPALTVLQHGKVVPIAHGPNGTVVVVVDPGSILSAWAAKWVWPATLQWKGVTLDVIDARSSAVVGVAGTVTTPGAGSTKPVSNAWAAFQAASSLPGAHWYQLTPKEMATDFPEGVWPIQWAEMPNGTIKSLVPGLLTPVQWSLWAQGMGWLPAVANTQAVGSIPRKLPLTTEQKTVAKKGE